MKALKLKKLMAFYLFMVFISIMSCRSKENNQLNFISAEETQSTEFAAVDKNADQWFLDEYTNGDIVPYHYGVAYFIAFRLVNQETKDLIRIIDIETYKRAFDPAKLLEFSNLEGLNIYNSDIHSLDIFSEIKSLKFLRIQDYASHDKTRNIKYDLSHLSSLSQLESIELLLDENFEIDFSGIENFPVLKNIFFRNYGLYRVKNTHNLAKATELERLDLYIDNGDISFLRNMAKLKELELYNRNGFDFYNDQRIKKDYYLDIDFRAGSGLISLEEMRLYGFTINNIETINELQNLKEVDIIDCYLNPNNDYSVISDRIRLRKQYFDVG